MSSLYYFPNPGNNHPTRLRKRYFWRVMRIYLRNIILAVSIVSCAAYMFWNSRTGRQLRLQYRIGYKANVIYRY